MKVLTKDGKYIYCNKSMNEDNEYIILFVHGLGEHIGRYERIIKYFNNNNIGFYGFDLRGHGLSEGKRGYINEFSDIYDDIDIIYKRIKRINSSAKIILYGHSLGGSIVLSYLLEDREEFDKVIATSPWIELEKEVKPAQIKAIRAIEKIYPSFTINNGLNAEDLSHDKEIVEKYIKDPLVHSKISFSLFLEAYDNKEKIYDLDTNIPIRIVHGSMDKITKPEGSIEFYESHKKNTSLKIYEGMFHETHNEYGYEKVLDDTLQWIKK